jgi:hypothetical protein
MSSLTQSHRRDLVGTLSMAVGKGNYPVEPSAPLVAWCARANGRQTGCGRRNLSDSSSNTLNDDLSADEVINKKSNDFSPSRCSPAVAAFTSSRIAAKLDDLVQRVSTSIAFTLARL